MPLFVTLPLKSSINSILIVDCCFLNISNDRRDDAVLDEEELVRFLRKRTLVGLVPLNYPLQVIRFRMSPEIQSWLTSYLYGIVCLHQEQASLWNDTAIKLFVVRYDDTEQDVENAVAAARAEDPDDTILPMMP